MLRRLSLIACFVIGCASLAAPQDVIDRDAYAREYIRFLVLQLDQWPAEFPRQFYSALMQPPVDPTKLSEEAKAGAAELGDAIKRLASLSDASDLTTSAAFRSQLDKTVATAKQVNQTIASQRFPMRLQSDWDQIRSTLNNLARVYKLEPLAVLEPPGGSGRSPKIAAGGGLAGYIVDQSCAKKGKGMWANPECVARCVRDGDKVVLVTDEGKLYQIANPDKIEPETYGQKVTITGKTDGDTITVQSLKL